MLGGSHSYSGGLSHCCTRSMPRLLHVQHEQSKIASHRALLTALLTNSLLASS